MQIEKWTDKVLKTIRVSILDKPGYLGKVASTIGELGGNIGDTRRIKLGTKYVTRDIEISVQSEEVLERILEGVGRIDGVIIEGVFDKVLELHRGGKIEMRSRVSVRSIADLRKIYTPGVARVCKVIQANPEEAWEYTSLGRTVGIVTNGTAILGLGDIGPVAGLPVMEGKAVLLDRLVGLSGVPLLIDAKEPDEAVEAIQRIASSFGAINLEDFKAPECFEIENRLVEAIPKPIMHDDQHGTGVVVLAALLNASKYCGMMMKNEVVGVIGLGAAGTGISKLLISYGVRKVVGTDLREEAMDRLNDLGGEANDFDGVMKASNIVVSTTGVPGLIPPEKIRKGQVILALSNPSPEIRPEAALKAGAIFASDGRSVNNALGFPGIFKGALAARATRITNRMKIAAAQTIASFAERGDLVPGLLDPEVHEAVARAVERAAFESAAVKPLV